MLVSIVSLRFNSTVLQSSTVEIENKVYLTAFSLADDMIEEVKNKSFDEKTIKFPANSVNNLTKADSLGPELYETSATFDDIDDYNNFSKAIDAPHAENYRVSCKVFYVQENNLDVKSTTQTFYKKLEVSVSSPYLRDNVKLAFIFTMK